MTIPLPLYPVRHHEPCCRPARVPKLHQADDLGACPPESGGASGDSDLQVWALRRSLLKNQGRQVDLRHSPPSFPGRGPNDLWSAFRRNRIRAIAWLCLFILAGTSGVANAKARVGICVAGATVRPLPNIPTNNLAAVAAGQKSRLNIGHISSRPTHRDRPGRQDRPGRRISLTISSRGLAATVIVRHRTSGYAKTPDLASGAFDVRAIRKQLTSNGELSLRAH